MKDLKDNINSSFISLSKSTEIAARSLGNFSACMNALSAFFPCNDEFGWNDEVEDGWLEILDKEEL